MAFHVPLTPTHAMIMSALWHITKQKSFALHFTVSITVSTQWVEMLLYVHKPIKGTSSCNMYGRILPYYMLAVVQFVQERGRYTQETTGGQRDTKE